MLADTDNDLVYTWSDNSVRAGNCSVSSDYPNYRLATSADAINFHPSVDFNGASDNMNCGGSMWPTSTSAGTLFVVGRHDNVTSAWEAALETGNDYFWGTLNERPITYQAGSTPNPIYGYPQIVPNTTILQSFDWNSGGTNATLNMRTNGNNSVSSIMEINNLTGTGFLGGGASGGSDTWGGPIAEVVAYKAQLTDADREKIESYLAIKYGITLTQGATNFATNAYNNTNTSVSSTGSTGQTFTASATGTINTISFNVQSTNSAPTATVYLCDATVSELATNCISGNPGTGKVNKVVTLPVNPGISTVVTVQFDT